MGRKVIIPVDTSEHSLRAFNFTEHEPEAVEQEREVQNDGSFSLVAPGSFKRRNSRLENLRPNGESAEVSDIVYIENLYKADDTILFLNVVHPPSIQLKPHQHTEPLDLDHIKANMEKNVNEAKAILEKYEQKCDEKQIPRETFLRSGEAGPGIIDLAKEKEANLIVMGSRGLNAIRRTFLGSVSDFVLHHSHVPVTVVPPPKQ